MMARLPQKLRSNAKLTIIVMVFCAALLVILLFWNRPSQEMVDLRKIESGLSLPQSTSRTENDRGEHTEDNGKTVTSRYISLEYDSSEKLKQAAEAIDSTDRWEQAVLIEFDSRQTYEYVNSQEKTCIKIDSDTTNDPPLFKLTISAKSDDTCKANINNS